MKKSDKIEQDINKTLDQFDHPEQLPPDPFFYTRLQARLAEKDRQPGILPGFLRAASLSVLLIVNLVTGVWYLGGMDKNYQSDPQHELAGILGADLELDNQESTIFLFEQE